MEKCANGHVRSEENSVYEGGRRRCRECKNASVRRRYARKKKEGGPNPFKDKVNRYRKSVREKVLDAYGNACACCGETQPLFLTMDHVNNDGAGHRKSEAAARQLYTWLVKNDFPDDFQILCWNCNVAKHLNGGTCPHSV